ncbi:hypothetical protein KBZ21_41275, partial [Streptomyces sp. A73]|nr:hypothetical protein [Streptomyces sp. A73]
MDEIRIPIKPLTLTAGTFTEIVLLDPDRPHTRPDERGCPDCGTDAHRFTVSQLAATRSADIRHLSRFGIPHREIAARVGV